MHSPCPINHCNIPNQPNFPIQPISQQHLSFHKLHIQEYQVHPKTKFQNQQVRLNIWMLLTSPLLEQTINLYAALVLILNTDPTIYLLSGQYAEELCQTKQLAVASK